VLTGTWEVWVSPSKAGIFVKIFPENLYLPQPEVHAAGSGVKRTREATAEEDTDEQLPLSCLDRTQLFVMRRIAAMGRRHGASLPELATRGAAEPMPKTAVKTHSAAVGAAQRHVIDQLGSFEQLVASLRADSCGRDIALADASRHLLAQTLFPRLKEAVRLLRSAKPVSTAEARLQESACAAGQLHLCLPRWRTALRDLEQRLVAVNEKARGATSQRALDTLLAPAAEHHHYL
jgi:hypothetical protein